MSKHYESVEDSEKDSEYDIDLTYFKIKPETESGKNKYTNYKTSSKRWYDTLLKFCRPDFRNIRIKNKSFSRMDMH